MTTAALDDLVARCRIAEPGAVRLDDRPTDVEPPAGLSKHEAEPLLAAQVALLSGLQERLYAASSWSVLLVFQALDAAGKDGTIKHVLSGVNPQGTAITAFKAPGGDELNHDFLWRVARALPARGVIGVFNRSHYEEVLVPRVHPAALARQRLPERLTASPGFWEGRLDGIAAFEQHLAREGTLILKFFLHVGAAEQRRRLLSRLDEPDKLWKFDPGDVDERRFRPDYLRAYEAAIGRTAAPHAPWFVIPADRKWLMRLLVARAVVGAMTALDLAAPAPDPATLARLREARAALQNEA